MSDRAEELGDEEGSEWRMRRARAAIDRSFDELVTSAQPPADGATSTAPPADPPEVTVAGVASRGPRAGAALDAALERRVAEAAESIERRVSARVRAAEGRLELQAQALEAALGEEAVQARLAAEQVEQVRNALGAATETALREIQVAFNAMNERAAGDPNAAALDEAEVGQRVELADRPEPTLRDDLARLRSELELVSAELSRRSIKRLEEALGAALELRMTALERRLAEACERNAELAEGRVKAASEAAEERIAAAERAQEREESVRRRTEAARAQAEGRVRAAERRLVEVLAELDRPDRDSSGPARLED